MLDKSQLTCELPASHNLSSEEIAKFDQLAQQWWDPQGKFKTALDFNRARLAVIEQKISAHYPKVVDNKAAQNAYVQPVTVLDVGSGGGLISESLAQRGYQVTGIDPSATSVEVAKRHAKLSGVAVNYRHALSTTLVEEQQQFDVVINAEVVEHVPDQARLIAECCALVKPGGLLILATLNRTFASFVIAILGAEYVMRYLPVGTHDWRKFVKPSELQTWASENQCKLNDEIGMKLNPFTQTWLQSKSLAVNYLQSYTKAMDTAV